ncbi:MAG TPA: hypothetical protein VGN89_13180 [Phenylobacterium sp.]|nr:hypothetical protein [Phenylobacterium sp.]
MFEIVSPTEIALTDPSEDRAQRRFRVLQELAEIGMELARDVQRQAREQAREQDRESAADLGLVFSRIARAVRQTVALEAKLDQDRQARRDKADAERAVEVRLRGIRRKTKVMEIVERVIETESDGERLLDDLGERLEDADDRDFADRPIGELVARICRDLGVTPEWALWEDEAWAIEALNAPPQGAWDAAPRDAPPDPPWPAYHPHGKPPPDGISN